MTMPAVKRVLLAGICLAAGAAAPRSTSAMVRQSAAALPAQGVHRHLGVPAAAITLYNRAVRPSSEHPLTELATAMKTTATRAGIDAGMTEAVVGGFFLVVGKHFVGLVHFLELVQIEEEDRATTPGAPGAAGSTIMRSHDAVC